MSEERKRKFEDVPAGEDSVKIPRVDGATGGQEETEDSKDLKPDLKPESDLKLEAAAQIAKMIAAQSGPKPVFVAPAPDDSPFQERIEIHDIRNRYLLTKEPTQDKIRADTGAKVTTKGVWYPDKYMATERDPPLYLHITANTKEELDAGIKAVNALIDQELGPLIDQSRFRDRDAPRERRKWPEEKIFITIEPLRNFNVRAKVVGPGGLFVKYIQQETQTRVQIKGINSGFVETETGREGEDPIHIHVTGPDQVMVDKAAEMAKDLLSVVKGEWDKASSGNYGGGASYGGPPPMYMGFGAQQDNFAQQGYGGQYAPPLPAGAAPPLPDGSAPPPPPPPSMPGNLPLPPQPAGSTATDAEWSAYWASLDAQGQAYFMQYYAAGSEPVAPAATQPMGGSGTYGNVPPPAGL